MALQAQTLGGGKPLPLSEDVFGEERRGDGHNPPLGRIHFLSQIAITVNVLLLPLIIMDGVGTGLQAICQQT